MKRKTVVSIIIRTKNEERWIKPCFDAIQKQIYKNFEIIVVDNNSIDKTLNKIKKYNVSKVVKIEEYLPGKALNLGIKYAKGKYIVCLSAHCIPKNKYWLVNLVNSLEEDKDYAGVYGRQEPMTFSTPADKRDLLLVFGLDRKIQKKDSFFHNANSIIRKDILEEHPFDPKITNIEDRIWAKEILSKGYKILYEPDARVLHYHGIHQNGDEERLNNVVKIIQQQKFEDDNKYKIDNSLNVIAIIPIKGKTISKNKNNLLKLTIENAKKSKFIKKIIVSTDTEYTKKIAISEGAICPFLRPKRLSEPHINIETVQNYTLEKIEKTMEIPDLVVHLEETFPFRPDNLIDEMIFNLINHGYDSIIAGREEPGWMWEKLSNGSFTRIDKGDIPRTLKDAPVIGLHGLCCVTYPEFLRNGSLLGKRIGIYKVDFPLAGFEVRDTLSANVAFKIIK